MERTEILRMLAELKLTGIGAAYDEVIATAIKRQHTPAQVIGELLKAEFAEKQARSIRYQIGAARLPLAKELAQFVFDGTPVNAALVQHLASGASLAQQRNAVLVGGTGTGKSHLAVAIARSCIRGGARARFYTVIDLVNRLETEARAGRQGRTADHLTRLDLVADRRQADDRRRTPGPLSGRPRGWQADHPHPPPRRPAQPRPAMA